MGSGVRGNSGRKTEDGELSSPIAALPPLGVNRKFTDPRPLTPEKGDAPVAIEVDLYRRAIKLPATPGGEPLTFSVVDAGPRDALRTVVFLHGFGGRAAYWQYQIEHFSGDNRVVALDLRGHGLSDAPHSRYTVEELVEDVCGILEALKVPENFILIAHSFGGALASYFMNKYPGRVEKLILIASPRRFILRWTGRTLLRLPVPVLQAARQFVPIVRLYPPAHVVNAWNRNALTPWDGTNYLRRISVPTLVILGQRDLLFKQEYYRDVAGLIPGASEIIIPVSAHQVMVERPDAVNRAIDRFIGPPPKTEERARRRDEHRKLEQTRPWLKFYDNRTPYQIDPPTEPVQRALELAARRYPKRPALVFYNQPMTYRALDKQANRFGQGLRRIGLKPGDRVLILMPNIPQALISYYGILKAGGVAVFSNPLFNQEQLQAQMKDSGATIVICMSLFYPMVRMVAKTSGVENIIVTSFGDYMSFKDGLLFQLLRGRQQGHRMPASSETVYSFGSILRRGSPTVPDLSPEVNALAVIQYTSGTTGGVPGGVKLSHQNLVANAFQVRHTLAEARPGEEVILTVLPFSHSYGLTSCLNLAPLLGATMILLPRFEVRETLEAISRYRPSIFPGVPQMYMKISQFPGVRRYGISSIRYCVSGGTPLAVEIQEAFEKLTRGRLVEGYGLSEASPVTHANPLTGRRKSGSIGIPLPDTEARIIGLNSGKDLPPEEIGELLVRGPQVMSGYWNRPEETARALDSDGWLHTGDIARMDEDGYFYIIDRKKDSFMVGEKMVFPREIEEVLFEHPKIEDVAVVGIPPETEQRQVKAFVVLRHGERATPAELTEFCRQRLASHQLPTSFDFIGELPRNFIGKVLRRVLAEKDRVG